MRWCLFIIPHASKYTIPERYLPLNNAYSVYGGMYHRIFMYRKEQTMRNGLMKRLTGSLLASAMCLTLVCGQVMPVSATEGTEMVSPASNVAGNSITVNNPVAGHEYRAYQIFTGDVSTDGNTLSNIRYGSCFANAGEAVTQEDLDKITDAKTFVKELLADSAGNYTSGGGIFTWRK